MSFVLEYPRSFNVVTNTKEKNGSVIRLLMTDKEKVARYVESLYLGTTCMQAVYGARVLDL